MKNGKRPQGIEAAREFVALLLSSAFAVALIAGAFKGLHWSALWVLGWYSAVHLGRETFLRALLKDGPKLLRLAGAQRKLVL